MFSRLPAWLSSAGKLVLFMKSIRKLGQPVFPQPAGPIDPSAAKREISVVWEQYKESTIRHYKDGFQFGRVCYAWRSVYTAQGSRSGKGFNRLLAELAIPRTTAYRWIRRYELKNGLRTKRNEVEDKHRSVHAVTQKRSPIVEGQVCFYFLLDEEQRYQFEEDVNALGGHERVSDMFVDFVSWKASQKRAAETKCSHEGIALPSECVDQDVKCQ